MKTFRSCLLLLLSIMALAAAAASITALPTTNPVDIRIVNQYTLAKKASSGSGSALYYVNVSGPSGGASSKIFSSLLKNSFNQNQTTTQPDYVTAPLVAKLKGSRRQIGYDYADLLAEQTSESYNAFLHKTVSTNATKIQKLENFLDWLWHSFYVTYTPAGFVEELNGMSKWANENPSRAAALATLPHDVSRRFLVLANMPADAPNIISGLEHTIEVGWPPLLKEIVNEIIKILTGFGHKCDAFGIFGSRTGGNGRLYTSRNLDFSKNTGLDKYKLIISYDITDGSSRFKYVSIGFAVGLGALAGMNQAGISTSEMNLDNTQTDFRGLVFPLRLRYVLEGSSNLREAMTIWNATNNTDSMNYLIGSGKSDRAAYALEAMWKFTAQFAANSPIEANATYNCGYPPTYDPTCNGWVWDPNNKYGLVKIGFPLPDAVWRTNHGMNPVVMKTQEPLFNDTVFRYRLAHDIIDGYDQSNTLFEDLDAVNLVASLGTKGPNFLTCDQSFEQGENILSVVYVPGEERMFVAWERGSGIGTGPTNWRPAACAPYVHFNVSQIWNL